MDTGRRFRYMFSSLGWAVADVAKFLQVSTRTVQLWCAGKVRVPYAAYKLLRLQLRYELPGDAWNGWSISAGRLYTPEGHELRPQDFTWWSLLVRKAAMFSTLYEKQTAEARALPWSDGMALAPPDRPRMRPRPPAELGGRAQRGLDLSLRHFGPHKSKNECLRGFQRVEWSGLLSQKSHDTERMACMATRGRPKKKSPFVTSWGLPLVQQGVVSTAGTEEARLLTLTPATLRARLRSEVVAGRACEYEHPQLVALWAELVVEVEAEKGLPRPVVAPTPAPPLTRQQRRALERSGAKPRGFSGGHAERLEAEDELREKLAAAWHEATGGRGVALDPDGLEVPVRSAPKDL